MAYSFNGSNQSISANASPVLDAPLTIFSVVYPNNVTSSVFIANIGASDSNAYVGISLEGNSLNDPVAATYRNAAASAGSSFKDSYVANIWQYVTGVFTSSASRTVFLDSVAGTTNTLNITDLGTMSRVGIGFLNRQTPALWANARIGDTAIWSAALTSDEVISLYKGYKPSRIRPQSLVFYAPLIRNIQDVARGLSLTNNNTATVADHPRVY
jgi:hypothetical protein